MTANGETFKSFCRYGPIPQSPEHPQIVPTEVPSGHVMPAAGQLNCGGNDVHILRTPASVTIGGGIRF